MSSSTTAAMAKSMTRFRQGSQALSVHTTRIAPMRRRGMSGCRSFERFVVQENAEFYGPAA
jgi:hypothetical protein